MMDKAEAIAHLRAFMEASGLTDDDIVNSSLEDLCPRKRWVPKNGERYHLISTYWQDIHHTWTNSTDDRRCLAIGNVFPTEEAARERIENMQAWVELRERSCEYIGASFHTVSFKGRHLPGVRFASAKSRDLAVVAVGGEARIEKLSNWVHNI